MQRIILLSALAFLLAANSFAQNSAAVSPADLAGRIWTEFETARWDAPYEEWKSAHAETACTQFHGGDTTWSNSEGPLWSYRCEVSSTNQKAAWTFYVLSTEEPLVCRLEHFHALASGISVETRQEVYAALQSKLEDRLGPGEAAARFLGEWGSAYWKNVRHWKTPELEVYIYLKDFRSEPPSLGLLARHRHLIDALAENTRLDANEWEGIQGDSGSPLDQALAKALGPSFPEFPNLLLEDPAQQQTPEKQAVISRMLGTLLQRTKTEPPGRRALLLVAADRLANRLQFPKPDENRSIKKVVEGSDLNFQWDELGGGWAYRHDLLWSAFNDYGATDWGERAFVLLLGRGWDTSSACGQGSDQFLDVIRRGEEFLQQHSASPYRADVMLDVAQAYETHWSLSQASKKDDYADAVKYQPGAAEARNKAISYYQKLLEFSPNSSAAHYARSHLPRLKLGLDTNQRRFFCIYD